MQNKTYYYISGFISILLYIGIFILFLFYMNSNEHKKFDSLSKTTVLQLDIVFYNQNIQQENIKKQSILKKSSSKAHKKQANYKTLFAKVDTEAKNMQKEDIYNNKANENISRFKSKFEKLKKNKSNLVSKILTNIKTKSTNKQISFKSNKAKTHPYYSKIKETLEIRWNFKFPKAGYSTKVLVIITKDGVFSYTIIKSSSNYLYDELLLSFLNEQKELIFLSHNLGEKVQIIINFKSKEK